MLTLIVVFVVLGVAAVVLSAPLVLHRLEPYALPAPPQAELSEADRLLEALSELEHSHLAGKLTEADYAALRERIERDYLRASESVNGDAS